MEAEGALIRSDDVEPCARKRKAPSEEEEGAFIRSDDDEPCAKKRKAPSEEEEGGGEKLCIICASSKIDGKVDTFLIFILDLSSADVSRNLPSPLTAPTFSIGDDCLSVESFCVLGSTLYLFERKTKSVRTYELPPNVSNLRLERHMLGEMPDMLGYKKSPIFTVRTPDMKSILVFSSHIDNHPDAAATSDFCDPDFEMYDPDSRSWRQFAGIPLSWRSESFRITSYTFMDNQHVLLLRTDTHMSFTLDIKSPEKLCQRLPFDNPRTLPVLERGYFIVAGGGHLCLSPTLAYDIRQEEGESGVSFFEYPQLPSLGHPRFARLDRCVALLHVDDAVCKFCVAQTVMSHRTLRPQITVKVYELDLQQYEKLKWKGCGRLPNLPCTRAVKSLQFQPDGDDLSTPLRLAYISAVGFNQFKPTSA